MSVIRTVKIEMFKIKVSRLVRGTIRKIKRKLNKGNEGTASSFFDGEIVEPLRENNTEQKLKSSAIVFLAGSAIGVSQVITVCAKQRVKIAPKSILGVGVVSGAVIATVWYNFIDAAAEGVSEEDIALMFELMNNTGFYENPEAMPDDVVKGMDILHTIITGKEMDLDRDSGFDIEEEEVDDKDEVDEDDPYNQGRVSFSDVSEDDDDDEDEGSPFKSKRSRPTGISTGKPLFSPREPRKGKRSFLPEGEDEEVEVKQTTESWMDLS